jgi:hypothetical protein
LVLVALSACARDPFTGPATTKTEAYMIHCGDETCDPTYYACSVIGNPKHCEFQGSTFPGAARDAGADQ